jgi:putative protein-disulfide isomerase
MNVLHYFHDPLCGWCYGAAPLIDAASRVAGLTLNLLAGGLWPQPTSLPSAMRAQIRAADARIGHMSGQPFGKAYLEGWLKDESTVLDSRPPTAAWLAAQAMAPERGLAMLQAIQNAHYVAGRRVVEADVLIDLAQKLGLDAEQFKNALAAVDVDAHIESTQRAMAQLGVSGFPTAFLERERKLEGVALQSFFGRPAEFAAALTKATIGS